MAKKTGRHAAVTPGPRSHTHPRRTGRNVRALPAGETNRAPEPAALSDIVFKSQSVLSVRQVRGDNIRMDGQLDTMSMFLQLYEGYLKYLRLHGLPTQELKGGYYIEKIREMLALVTKLVKSDSKKADVCIVSSYEKKYCFVAFERYDVEQQMIISVPFEFLFMMKAEHYKTYVLLLPLIRKLVRHMGFLKPVDSDNLVWLLDDVLADDDPESALERIQQKPETAFSMHDIYGDGGLMIDMMREVDKAPAKLSEEYLKALKRHKGPKTLPALARWMIEGYNILSDRRCRSLANFEFYDEFPDEAFEDFYPVRLEDCHTIVWSMEDELAYRYVDQINAQNMDGGELLPYHTLVIDKNTKEIFKKDDWYELFHRWILRGVTMMSSYSDKKRKMKSWQTLQRHLRPTLLLRLE